jgi:ribosome-binding factor A
MRHSKRGYDRTQRVADLIQKALAQILPQEMVDDRFRFVTITSVTVSRDLSYAKVYVTVLLDEADKIKQTVVELNRNAKALRYSLAREVDLRVMPELRFVYDESTAHGFRLSNLIDSAVKKSGEEEK